MKKPNEFRAKTRQRLDSIAPGSLKQNRWNVIVETAKGNRNKYKYDPELDLFKLGAPLPSGAVFPFDFGFLPGTLGEDGDPLDVLLLMEEPAFLGCLVEARLIGVIEAMQKEKGQKAERNDRLIAVPVEAENYDDIRTLSDLS